MDALYIVTVYVVLADSLQAAGYQDDVRCHVTAAEVLTVAVVAARYFQNHQERALCILIARGDLPPLSVSRFNRRLHQVARWLGVVLELARQPLLSSLPEPEVFVLDALPIPACKRIRQRRCRKVRGDAYVGYCAAKREWFFGFKLHWRCDVRGVPMACTLLPARMHELRAVPLLVAQVPAGAVVVGDGAYVSIRLARRYRAWGVRYIAKRYGRMSPNTPSEQSWLAYRRGIEVAHSQLEKMGIQRLHAPTLAGFILKIGFSLFALLCNHLLPILTGN